MANTIPIRIRTVVAGATYSAPYVPLRETKKPVAKKKTVAEPRAKKQDPLPPVPPPPPKRRIPSMPTIDAKKIGYSFFVYPILKLLEAVGKATTKDDSSSSQKPSA